MLPLTQTPTSLRSPSRRSVARPRRAPSRTLPPGHGGRGVMERPDSQPRIPALCALLLVAAILGVVWLTPLGSPSEAVSQVAPPAPQMPPPPAPPHPSGPDGAAFPVPAEW